MSDCNKPEIPDMIACLRDLDIKNLTKTTNAYAVSLIFGAKIQILSELTLFGAHAF